MNRLNGEKSPYLLQHADQPVDWYPWGEEAFAAARERDVPVFLSIGYSTCHWCHVMAEESFADPEVAEALNHGFVCVKVDREERPDVDAVYMAVCQALTGSGGWPLTIVMTPEQKPFFAGTYLPKRSRYGSAGLLELLTEIHRLWHANRDRLLKAGNEIARLVARREETKPGTPGRDPVRRALAQFRQCFDERWGGFGPAPKFPMAHNLIFLLRAAQLEGSDRARQMAEFTLERMYRGGIFDHIGGGFARYSTDERWLVPHFEKMLYDNALLALAYVEAYRATRRPLYRRIAEWTLDYVLRELTGAEGEFLCGQDADSNGEEGGYYLLTPAQVREALGAAEGEAFCRRYGLIEDAAGIPHRLDDPGYEQEPPAPLQKQLLAYRQQRAPLRRDDKALTAWNGLMILAMAEAGWSLEKPAYLEAAQRAQRFVAARLTQDDGRLLLRWRDGEAAHPGQLDDHAFYALGLLGLYRGTWDPQYLQLAERTARWIPALFADGDGGGFFRTPRDGERLIARPKESYDGALPSGNSAAGLLFGRLARLTGKAEWEQARGQQLVFLAGEMREQPMGYGFALLAMLEAAYPAAELLCATAGDGPAQAELAALGRAYLPNLALLVKAPASAAALAQAAPFSAAYPLPERGARFYLCQDGSCRAPVESGEQALAVYREGMLVRQR